MVTQPSPFRPPEPSDRVQFSFAAQPLVFGSIVSVVADRKFPGIATGHLLGRAPSAVAICLLLWVTTCWASPCT
jgi:hypothetical protein